MFSSFFILSQVTTDLHHKCTEEFKGTSSAAPLAAGMFALVLQAKYVCMTARTADEESRLQLHRVFVPFRLFPLRQKKQTIEQTNNHKK